jgi:hypothetical protein
MGNRNQNWRTWDVFSLVSKQRETVKEEITNSLSADLCSSQHRVSGIAINCEI